MVSKRLVNLLSKGGHFKVTSRCLDLIPCTVRFSTKKGLVLSPQKAAGNKNH